MHTTKNMFVVGVVVIGLLGASAAQATDSVTKPIKESDVKSLCDKTGGKFESGTGGYSCTNECNGGPCEVSCVRDQYCTIHTPERRAANASYDPKASPFLVMAATGASGSKDSSSGWLGLFGLIGLAGLLAFRREAVRPERRT